MFVQDGFDSDQAQINMLEKIFGFVNERKKAMLLMMKKTYRCNLNVLLRFRQYVSFLLFSRSIHAKCQILAWNLVLVGCPLKTLHRYRNINIIISKKPGKKLRQL
jgi:hypothetical protein